jgi:hypothetical protein
MSPCARREKALNLHFSRNYLILIENLNIMAKEKSVKKEAKKAPALTPKEKKLAKAEKKSKKSF